MRQLVRAFFLSVLLCACIENIPTHIERGSEDAIAQILSSMNKDGTYTVLAPETSMGLVNVDNRFELEAEKLSIKMLLMTPGYDVSQMVDALFAVNHKTSRFSLPSSKENGYVVDYDEKYLNYFKGTGDGWEKLREANPNVRGITRVSIPIFDRKQNILMMYINVQNDWLAGDGRIVIYKYEAKKLHEISSATLWIS